MGLYQPAYTPDEIYHHGVKGMRWGVRKSHNSGGKSANTSAKSKGNKDGRTEKAINNAKKKVTKEKAAKYALKGARIANKVLMASLADDIFLGGAGKKAIKTGVKQAGRAVVTAYTMANGGYDIRWYDN